MFFQSKKILGLDIGTTSIKLAELDVGRKGATLISFSIVPTPQGAMANGDIVDAAALSEAVKNIFASSSSNRKFICGGICGNPVIVKKVSIPRMEEKLIAEQIKWEAEQYIPFDMNETNLDYRTLNQPPTGETMDVLLVAAKQDAIFRLNEIIETSGKTLNIVDVSGFALAQCFEQNYNIPDEQAVALVNLGGAVTNVTVLNRNDIVFSRDILLGGINYSNEIQRGLNLTADEAEVMKISASQGQAVPEDLMTILEKNHKPIAEEILSSLEFFQNSTNGILVSACFVTGGASRTPGLIPYLNKFLKISTQPLDPFRSIKHNSSKLSQSFISQIADVSAVAIGLGLRKEGDS